MNNELEQETQRAPYGNKLDLEVVFIWMLKKQQNQKAKTKYKR